MAALEEQPMKRMQVDECSVQLTLYVAEPYVGDRRSKVDELQRRAAAARRPLTGGHRRTVQLRKESVAPSTRRPASASLAAPLARPCLLMKVRLCLLYTSDAADEEDSVDLGGRRI